jgi:CheY-like chemotaxis protein
MVDKVKIKKVLLVDDDDDDCMVFKMAVGEIDSSIRFIYRTSCDGLAPVLLDEKPDIVFLDINLPRVNGIECLLQIRDTAREKNIPVVMYSSSELPKDLAQSYQNGAALYFRKPNNITILVDALRNILQMDWHQPDNIKAQYFKDGVYHVYEASLLV